MTPREWLRATWAEWCPSYREGRFECGPLVITSRRRLSQIAWRFREIGQQEERRRAEARA